LSDDNNKTNHGITRLFCNTIDTHMCRKYKTVRFVDSLGSAFIAGMANSGPITLATRNTVDKGMDTVFDQGKQRYGYHYVVLKDNQ